MATMAPVSARVSNGLDRFGGAVDQVVNGVEVERLLEKGFEAAAMKIVRSY